MTSFHGCFALMLFFFFFFIIRSSRAAGRENPLFDLSTRADLVQLAGYGEEKLSSVLVTGTVLCEACLEGDTELREWPVSGASVAVTCKTGGRRTKMNWAEATADEYGDFIIDLPSHLHAIPNLDKACSVRVLWLPKSSPCWQVFIEKPRRIRLSSVGNDIRTYTAGSIRFQQPHLSFSHTCLKKGDSEQESSW